MEGVNWIDVGEDRDRWWLAVVNAVTNLGFHEIRGVSGLVDDLLATQVVLCFMELWKGNVVKHNYYN